jgi:hypothetical protein
MGGIPAQTDYIASVLGAIPYGTGLLAALGLVAALGAVKLAGAVVKWATSRA